MTRETAGVLVTGLFIAYCVWDALISGQKGWATAFGVTAALFAAVTIATYTIKHR